MMGFLGLIILYWVTVYYGISFGLPLLYYLLRFLLLAHWIALQALLMALVWVTGGVLRFLHEEMLRYGRGAALVALLLYYFIDESLRGGAGDEGGDDEFDDGDDEQADAAAAQSAMEAASALFGLGAAFSREELGRAYKIAIRKAHPDLGGSVERAQELNVARDLIMSANGWA